MQGIPSWANVATSEDNEPLDGVGIDPLTPPLKAKSPCTYWSLKLITMSLCCLMAATACLGLAAYSGIDDFGSVFVSIYMLFFSILLFLFEFVQIRPVESLDHVFQRNFGFLYSPKGKAFYIIFIAFLSFGLKEPDTLPFVSGALLAMFGIGKLVLYLKNPDLFE